MAEQVSKAKAQSESTSKATAASAGGATTNKTVYIGRPGSNLKMGIVGLPNAGKSTFFNVLSKKSVPAENRPFCTIEPNNADINVPDWRFDKLVKIHQPKSAVPAQLHIRDIAGLVRGASEGEGLGNAFLSHIAEVDGIFHMCRVFDEEVTHIEGDIEPVRDLEIIFDELCLKDLQAITREIEKLEPILKRGLDKTRKPDLEMLYVFRDHLKANKQIRCGAWNGKEIEYLQTLHLITAKPAVFLVNMSETDFLRQKNKHLVKLKKWIDETTGEPMVPISAQLETRLLGMSPAEQEEFVKENKAAKSCITKVVTTGFHSLNLIYFFTAGADEVKCWTVQKGWKAPQAAGRIHTDMEKGFICAETIHWEDFDKLESEAACRDEGKQSQMGKTYEVLDGDIMFFKFNPKGGKK